MSMFVIVRSEEDLQHHGILGMKWGVRRFQAKDGTYTAAGRRRYDLPVKGGPEKAKPVGVGAAVKGGPSKTKPKGVLATPKSVSDKKSMKENIADRKAALREKASKLKDAASQKLSQFANTEMAQRGKDALKVLKEGDTDWMGNHQYNDDVFTESKNRGKAAIERLLYSREQIENKKFFNDYDY